MSAISDAEVLGHSAAPRGSKDSSLRSVLEEAGYRPYGEWAWQGYKPSIIALAKKYGLKRLLEIGGGRDPLFTPQEAAEHGFEVTINDISAVELENMKANFGTACFDVSGDISATGIAKGAYDLAYSRMVFEHVKDVERAWSNLHQLLAPGGVAIAFYPTLYCPPFVVNKVIPESVSSAIVTMLYKNRTADEDPKFPAFYDHCYGAPGLVEPMLREIGYRDVAVLPFYGHDYFAKLPVLREIDAVISNLARRTNFGRLSAFAYAVVRK